MEKPRFNHNASNTCFHPSQDRNRSMRPKTRSSLLEDQPRKRAMVLSNIVLIDTNAHFLKAMRKTLAAARIDLRATNDPARAKDTYFMAKAMHGLVDLVVANSLSFDENIHVLDDLREHDPDAKVLVICGDIRDDERKALEEAGASAIIRKDVRPTVEELKVMIAENIGPG